MQSIFGFSVLLAVVLTLRAIRPDASGKQLRFLTLPGIEEAFAFVLTVAAAMGVLVACDGLTSLY